MHNTMVKNTFGVQLFILFPVIQGIIYGPSLEYLTSGPGVEAETSLSRRIIKLADYAPYYSVVVPLAVNKTTAEPSLVRPVGEFSVEAPENMRIMAVIQSLHMRKKSVTSAFPPVCRDYILFGDSSINRICGDVHKSDKKSSPNGMMGERTFLSSHNVLNVTVFTDVSTFVEEWMKKPNVVEISFTAYQTCQFYDPDMLNCLENIIPHSPSCIPLNLSCDGVVNCGFLSGGAFSKDEENCPPPFPEIVPTTAASPAAVTITTPRIITPKPGFPSWWDNYNNWNKMRSDHANVFSSNNNNWNVQYGGDGDSKYSDTYPKAIFDTDLKSSNGYWNSFILYALCLFAGISGISVILKIMSRYCAEDKPPGVNNDSHANLMQNSSTATVPIENDGSSETPAGGDGLFAIPRPQIAITISVPVPFAPNGEMYDYDCEPPPPYDSLFPENANNK